MGKTLYLECNSGISGDMMVAALLDLGADLEVLDKALKSLSVHGFETEISRVKKAGLDVCDFNVKLDTAHENHDHDMEYLYGHNHKTETESHVHDKEEREESHGHHHEERTESHGNNQEEREESHGHHHEERAISHGHQHVEEAEVHVHHHDEKTEPHRHHHDEGEGAGEHVHHHEHRGLPEILEIIDKAVISQRAKDTAARIFRILAQAEAKAHGVSMDQVHFHEVGAVDSIVDIIAVAVCLDNLDITRAIVPILSEGQGTVRCQHGILPVPVPAVVNIMEAHHLPVRITEVEGELVTPTGAAIVAAIKTSSELPEQFTISRTGIGAGKRNYKRPSLLRAMLIEENEKSSEGGQGRREYICKLESNIDDCTGESLGYAMDRLMEAGARDVHFVPVYMKKNRPAYELVVICDEEHVKELEQIIFQETTTIGIRRTKMERTVLPREAGSIMLKEGELKVKRCTLPDGQVRCYPEYDSVVDLAQKSGQSFLKVTDEFKRTILLTE